MAPVSATRTVPEVFRGAAHHGISALTRHPRQHPPTEPRTFEHVERAEHFSFILNRRCNQWPEVTTNRS